MFTRRTLLRGSIAAGGLLATAVPALANPTNGCRFLFVLADGGWDPLCIFAPLFDAGSIDMEEDAEPWTLGNFNLVDSPQRPQTRAFFERRHQQIVLLNGVSTRSVNHRTCLTVAMTGSTSVQKPDWASILGYEARGRTTLPHLVLSGDAFPGPYSVYVSYADGMLQSTIDGTILIDSESPVTAPPTTDLLDAFLLARAEARVAEPGDPTKLSDYDQAVRRSHALVKGSGELPLVTADTLEGQLSTAIAALAGGICQCVTVSLGGWDTHADNSQQTPLFEELFAAVDGALDHLASTPSPDGGMLSDDTVVVLITEMGRTPAYNGSLGRDHWPYTSMMLIGPGLDGGRSYGGYTSLYTGIGVGSDGGLDPSQPGIPSEAFGATLLALGGLDPARYVGIAPIGGVLT
ncbi:MAG: DUF1501 domain-containing protein [Myxococcota bacterium]